MDGAAELWRTLLPASEVPLDMSARTHRETLFLSEAEALSGSRNLAPPQTERRATISVDLVGLRTQVKSGGLFRGYVMASALTT